MEKATNPLKLAEEWIEKDSDSSQKVDGVQMVVSTFGNRGYPTSRVVRLRVSYKDFLKPNDQPGY